MKFIVLAYITIFDRYFITVSRLQVWTLYPWTKDKMPEMFAKIILDY